MKCRRIVLLLLVTTLVGLFAPLAAPAPPAAAYPIETGSSSKVAPIDNCADPAVTPTPVGGLWYMYCTADPLNDVEESAGQYHLIPILSSPDLVTWTYVGDVFSKRPRWVAADAGLWAPDIQYFNGKWYLYYSASGSIGKNRNGQDSAIGAATATHPKGPWTDSGGTVVEKQADRWVIDPFVIADEQGQRYIFYGTMAGGMWARPLSSDGLRSAKSREKQIAVADRYEGAFIVKRGGYYYLFASATNCCNVGLTAYGVFVGRSATLLGPYLDRQGASFLDSRVGGTPVLNMNGDRWIGPGHNAIVTVGTQDYFVYHAIDREDPDFGDNTTYTKRPAHVDKVVWTADGWPVVQRDSDATYLKNDAPGSSIGALSDEFNQSREGWSWLGGGGQPAAGTYGLSTLDGKSTFSFKLQDADLWQWRNNASVYAQGAPSGDYVVEARVHLPLPANASNYNYAQAGLVIYGDDDNYVKLVHVAIGGTRQTGFGKEVGGRYGNGVGASPADWTYLRIVRRANPAPIDPAGGDQELYTAYTSTDGTTWVRGATWTHTLGTNDQPPRIGLVAMGNGSGTPFTANFDYVRVSTLAP